MSGVRSWSSRKKKVHHHDTAKQQSEVKCEATSKPIEFPEVQCEHMEHIRLERVKRKILTPADWSCSECGTTEGVWACLTCGKFGCGRYQSEHALGHYEVHEHPLALEINQKYCHCYVCDGYVSNDNKKEDLETLRKLLDNIQNVDESVSTTRSGKIIRPPPKIQNSIEEFEDEDRLHTAIKHWRLRTFINAFQQWKTFTENCKTKKIPPTPPTKSQLIRSGAHLQSIRNGLTQSQTVILTKGGTLVPGVTGLRNLGNTCFMNTVLQALSNTADFCNFFVHILGAPSVDGSTPVPVKVNGKMYIRRPTAVCFEDAAKQAKMDDVSLTMQLHTLLRVLWSGKWAVATPYALLEAVWKFVPKFRNRQQQDAQEFLCYLFDRLQMELQEIVDKPQEKGSSDSKTDSKPTKKPRKMTTRSSIKKETEKKLADAVTTSDTTDSEPGQENSTKLPTPTIVTELFQGKLLSEIVCEHCKNKSLKVDPFLDLPVDIPVVSLARHGRRRRQRVMPNVGHTTYSKDKDFQANGKRKREENEPKTKKAKRGTITQDRSDSDEDQPELCKLEDCIFSFVKPEIIEGYACEKCKDKSNASRRLYLQSLPRVLCVVLKRFSWTSSARAKIDTQVHFPFVLDVKEFSAPTAQNNSTYDLTSIVLHHGVGLLSGHYTSYCYNKLQNVWVHYNDSRVGFVTKEEIEREAPSKAYLLFYEKRNTASLPILANTPFKLSSSLSSFTPMTFNSPLHKK